MPQLTPEQVKQYYASEGQKAKPLSPLDWLAQQTKAPGSLAEETKAGEISITPTPTPTSVTGGLSDFRVALKTALNEAAKDRSAARFTQLYPAVGGVPGTMGDIAKMIRGSVAPPVEDVFTTILETMSEGKKQALNLLEVLAKDGTLGSLPDSALTTLAGTAGLDANTAIAWKSRIAEALKLDTRTAELEIAKIQSEIEENRAQTAEIKRKGSEDQYAPTSITFAYADRVQNDPEFDLINVPEDGGERNRVAKYLMEKNISQEKVTPEGVAEKLRTLKTIGQTGELTDNELKLYLLDQKETQDEKYDSIIRDIPLLPITNKERALDIAAEVYGVKPLPVTPEETGAFLPKPKETKGTKTLRGLFPEDFVYEPPNFLNFPSLFRF